MRYGVASGALFGVPSLIQPHFHSQGIMPFCSGRGVLEAYQSVDQSKNSVLLILGAATIYPQC